MLFQILFLFLHALVAPLAKALPQYFDGWSEPAFSGDRFTIASGVLDSAPNISDDRESNDRTAFSINSDTPPIPGLDSSKLYLSTLQRPSFDQSSPVELAGIADQSVFMCCPNVEGEVQVRCQKSEFAR